MTLGLILMGRAVRGWGALAGAGEDGGGGGGGLFHLTGLTAYSHPH